MVNILLEAEDGPLSEMNGLMHNCSKNLSIVKGSGLHWLVRQWIFSVVTHGTEDLRSLQDVSFNSIGFNINLEVPLLDFLAVGNHPVEFLDAANSLVWFLEETLSDVSHHLLVLSDLRWDTDKGAEFWRQVDVLALLSNFKKWLINGMYFDVVSCHEVVDHICACFFISMVKDVILGVHVPFDGVYLVCSVWSVFSHHNGSFELPIDEILVVALQPILD